jgi:endonuclease/exonuclease/phosphatase (EEP) superfamily protein YafD
MTAAVVIAGALLVRLTVQDSRPPFAVFFYATPWGVIWFLSLSALAASRVSRDAVPFRLLLGVAALLFITFLAKGCHSSEPPPQTSQTGPPVRALFWNIAFPDSGAWRERVARAQAASHAPDVMVLSEVRMPKADKTLWESEFGLPHTKRLRRDMMILSRYPLELIASDSLKKFGDFSLLRIQAPEVPFFLLAVDVHAIPSHPRLPPLSRVAELAAAYETQPLLILGDFNTPSDSVHFKPLRLHARSVWEVAGNGWGNTWPNPVPVMQLDQGWVNGRLHLRSAAYGDTMYSDHRPLVIEFAVSK